jgi:putative Holliday junction resolvase
VQPRILAVDYGRVRLGLAVSDALGMASHPLPALRRSSPEADLLALRALIADREVARLVVGLPLNMDGSEGPRCQSVRQFAANIANHGPPALANLPVFLQDERLSTAAVTRGMIEDYDMSRAKRAERVDAAAAAWILESALPRLR